jgi:hypothetical protein
MKNFFKEAFKCVALSILVYLVILSAAAIYFQPHHWGIGLSAMVKMVWAIGFVRESAIVFGASFGVVAFLLSLKDNDLINLIFNCIGSFVGLNIATILSEIVLMFPSDTKEILYSTPEVLGYAIWMSLGSAIALVACFIARGIIRKIISSRRPFHMMLSDQ